MKKNIYIFRHGQTELNAKGIFQGQKNNPELNEQGIKQAQGLADRLIEKKLDIIYTSPLQRAIQTAEIANFKLQVPIIIENELIEGNFGIAEGQSKEHIKNNMPVEYTNWRNLDDDFLDCRFDGGESKREIQTRFFNCLDKIVSTQYSNIGISTHSAIIRSLLLRFGQKKQTIENGCLIHLVFQNNQYQLVE